MILTYLNNYVNVALILALSRRSFRTQLSTREVVIRVFLYEDALEAFSFVKYIGAGRVVEASDCLHRLLKVALDDDLKLMVFRAFVRFINANNLSKTARWIEVAQLLDALKVMTFAEVNSRRRDCASELVATKVLQRALATDLSNTSTLASYLNSARCMMYDASSEAMPVSPVYWISSITEVRNRVFRGVYLKPYFDGRHCHEGCSSRTAHSHTATVDIETSRVTTESFRYYDAFDEHVTMSWKG